MPPDPTSSHVWFTPADCAALLDATPYGAEWRAACPAHGGDNPTALSIAEGRDSYGNPATMLHCFAHDCAITDICAAMGIHVRNLFCIHPDYPRQTRKAPRAHSPRVEQLRKASTAYTPGQIAQMLLEEMIVSDPEWIATCAPARAKMWELARSSPTAREAFTGALRQASLAPMRFWDDLAREQGA